MPRSTGENWMGAPEAAEYLGVTVPTIYKLVNDGDLRAYRVGRIFRYAGMVCRYPPRS